MKKNTKSTKAEKAKKTGTLRFADIFVVVLFLSIAAFSINLFRIDLLKTIDLKNVKSIGTVVIKKNTVQRRLSDRVLWDRLASTSPVYLGDLIRVAELSAATLVIEGNNIDLNENTLIRLTRATDGESLKIEMSEGFLSLSADADSRKVFLDVGGRQIQPTFGAENTVLNIIAEDKSLRLRVNEGTVQLTEEGQTWEINAGSFVSLELNHGPGSEVADIQSLLSEMSDRENIVRTAKNAVVIQPASNAHLINGSKDLLAVNFLWNRINLDEDEALRLEIAADRSFNRIVHSSEDSGMHARASLENGSWYWRLLHNSIVFDEGRLFVVNGTGPGLRSPLVSSVYNFTDELPVLNFQWDEVEEASMYLLEVSDKPDFALPQIRSETPVTFFSGSGLGEGTWYWRVMPVFSAAYTGTPSFTPASYFNVVHNAAEASAGTSTDLRTIGELSLAEWLAQETPPELVAKPEPPPEPVPEPPPPQPVIVPPPPPKPVEPVLRLTSPAQGARLAGLTALRQPTILTWTCNEAVISSRLVISRNPNPFQGTPFREIVNPGRTVSLSRLDEGTWYWNVEARTSGGFTVRAREHGMLRVLAIPLLPAPRLQLPPRGHRFTLEDLQAQRSIDFRWQETSGANAYILTIFQQTNEGMNQVFRSPQLDSASYHLENLRFLDVGTFIWRVEALNTRADGTIDQRGNPAESSFLLEFALPTPIQIDGTGVH